MPAVCVIARRASRLEDAAAPTFAQLVGFVITGLGAVVGLVVPVAAALAFVAAFLNAVFDVCHGCRLHVLLLRAGLVRRPA